jgi:4-hydroxybenzoate polyprenyltransferase
MPARPIVLLRASHPLPTIAVTLMSAGLAALAGVDLGRAFLLVGAVLTGQLSIGWSNDAIDAERDRAAGRADKPVGRGEISPKAVWTAGVVAAALSLALSATLGLAAGAAAFAIPVCGWAYNLGLKATAFSFVPYAIAFGLLPAAATLSAPGAPWPAPWALVAGATLGVSIHLFNVLPDLRDDTRARIRGLPHRIGARGTAVAGPVLLTAATVVIVTGPSGVPAWWSMAGVGVVGVLCVVAVVVGLRDPRNRVLFVAAVIIAGADIALFAASGAALVS